jgi:hypothetical protein
MLRTFTLRKEEASLAFVRRKKVRDYTYYQLVRNYRKEGKHRQEMLAHLGHHDSLEAAILAEERTAATMRELKFDPYCEWLARKSQERLDQLLGLMDEYPQPIRSSRTFDLLRHREAQKP